MNLQMLHQMIAPATTVRTLIDGKWKQVSSTELVPGDIVFMKREAVRLMMMMMMTIDGDDDDDDD